MTVPSVEFKHIHFPSMQWSGSNEPSSRQRTEYCGYRDWMMLFIVDEMREQSELRNFSRKKNDAHSICCKAKNSKTNKHELTAIHGCGCVFGVDCFTKDSLTILVDTVTSSRTKITNKHFYCILLLKRIP